LAAVASVAALWAHGTASTLDGAEARACSDYTALGLCGGQLNGSRSRSVEKPGGNLWRLKDAEPEA
jgi:hypothetical protein